jgi:hypothetical protein
VIVILTGQGLGHCLLNAPAFLDSLYFLIEGLSEFGNIVEGMSEPPVKRLFAASQFIFSALPTDGSRRMRQILESR